MPATALACTVVTLKNADGTVGLSFQDPFGTVRYYHVFPAADFTSINTTTNGGASGATQTFVYAQDVNRIDYPNSYNYLTT
jgi:hypothetical protein